MAKSHYGISIQPGYVLVEDPPDYDVVWAEQPAKLDAISAMCEVAECSKVLIRGTTANVKMTPAEMFKLGSAVADLHLKIAVVTSHDAPIQDVKLLENAATNRGSRVTFFDCEQDALAWLDV